MPGRRRVCVLGAGVSGLVSIKSCLEQGLEPVCFERNNDIGGLWNMRTKQNCPFGAGVYRGLVSNSSKEFFSFSDFPFPARVPPMPTHKHIDTYLHEYAKSFDLTKHIRFNTSVRYVRRTSDYSRTGRWEVLFTDKNGIELSEVFDAVMLCSGYFTVPKWTEIPGLKSFQGQILHSASFSDPAEFLGKRVLVVGNGISAGDIAVNLHSYTDKVYLSVRGGSYVLPRITNDGIPLEFHTLFTRAGCFIPGWCRNIWMKHILENNLNHTLTGMAPDPKSKALNPVMFTNELRGCIICGAVEVKAGVKGVEGNRVHFIDGSCVENIDVILVATGYKYYYPLEKGIISDKPESANLYKLVFPASLPHPSLAVIGHFVVAGSTPPLCELQARWATLVFTGERSLPEQPVMQEDWRRRVARLVAYYGSFKLRVPFVMYADELAGAVGCKPDFLRSFFQDPSLFLRLLFGPVFPVQYRLQGPNAWSKARENLMQAFHRTVYATQTRVVEIPTRDLISQCRLCAIFVLFLLFVFFTLCC